ncbi:MAG: YkgJ family cysteine cluster protein [Spirochaetia bacterium]|nr:YkgJ family cysteine cluster protein [Spirochaetia bacterium]
MDDNAVFEHKKRNFECLKCGNCCEVPGYVYLNLKEADRMAKSLNMRGDEFLKKYTKRELGHLVLKTPFKGGCIFFKEKKCTIYEVRPSQCRTFPYWKELTADHEEWKTIEKYCKGAGKLV